MESSEEHSEQIFFKRPMVVVTKSILEKRSIERTKDVMVTQSGYITHGFRITSEEATLVKSGVLEKQKPTKIWKNN